MSDFGLAEKLPDEGLKEPKENQNDVKGELQGRATRESHKGEPKGGSIVILSFEPHISREKIIF